MTKRRKNQERPQNNSTPTKAIYTLKTEGQEHYWDCLNECEILFCDGVFGTGKTYLACVKAVDMLLRGEIDKIIICRPTVVTGKKGIGHLPGSMQDKLNPYMRPIKEQMQKVLGQAANSEGRGIELYQRFVEHGKISIESLDYIRGNNFHNTFMILDESENADRKQIDAFVSRMGDNSRVVICGDSDQTDLVERRQVLEEGKVIWKEFYNCDFLEMWNSVYAADDEQVGACELTAEDIVRSEILKKYLKITR